MTSNQIIGIALAAIVLTIDVITDYRLRLKYLNVVRPQGSVRHKYGFWLCVAGLIPSFILCGWLLFGVIAFAYWHLKDGLTNVLWKNNWFRIGTTAGTDTFQRRYPWLTWVKYIGLFAFILLLILSKVVPDFGFKP